MKTKLLALTLASGFIVFLICIGFMWLGGCNFDKRTPDLAIGLFVSLIFGVAAAGLYRTW